MQTARDAHCKGRTYMTPISKYLLGAGLAATMALGGITPGFADNLCGLTDNQLSHGWVCEESTVVTNLQREIGSGIGLKCQPGTQTTTIWNGINPGHQVDPDHSGEIADDPVWGPGAGTSGPCA